MPALLIKDVLLFTGHDFVENAFVLVRDGKIAQVGSDITQVKLEVNDDKDVQVVSKPGHTLIPGLIDAHIHSLGGNVQALEQPIRFGVTTVCDMHNDHHHNLNLAALAADPQNKAKYSDFKCAGLGAMVEGGWPGPVIRREFEHKGKPEIADAMLSSWPKLSSPSDAAPFIETQVKESNASYIKIMHELGDCLSLPSSIQPDPLLPHASLPILRAIVSAATTHSPFPSGRPLPVVGHAFSYKGTMELLSAGVTGLTHIFIDQAPSPAHLTELIELMRSTNAHCNPTLATCASQTGEGLPLQTLFATRDPLAAKMLFDPTPRGNIGLASSCSHASSANALSNAQALYRQGVPLIVGSDAAGQSLGSAYGMGVHMEMWRFVHEVGMDAASGEVLRAATSLTAERFGFEDRGVVEVGRKADLVLLEGDVREKMADPEVLCLPVRKVWRDGVLAEAFQDDE